MPKGAPVLQPLVHCLRRGAPEGRPAERALLSAAVVFLSAQSLPAGRVPDVSPRGPALWEGLLGCGCVERRDVVHSMWRRRRGVCLVKYLTYGASSKPPTPTTATSLALERDLHPAGAVGHLEGQWFVLGWVTHIAKETRTLAFLLQGWKTCSPTRCVHDPPLERGPTPAEAEVWPRAQTF